ncbi:uncharacterized protein LOC106638466 [Copidosoma floridanum]|uniref:uncharacterized protein LOC106638466 n=1 Tax=Copidosoma floridanum TaxID=29053 RepID=UPI0006C9DAE2|nr:uncharacterized protein LOC106638466 [Copidosoma floridanum]
MPGCAAVGCNNRSEKGYTMKCFPRDPALRTVWKKKVGRADWEPSNNSFLCHVHFDKSQWLNSSNGKIRLKKGAIPSIFTVTSTRKSPKKKQKVHKAVEEVNLDEFEVEYLDSSSPLILGLTNQKSMPNIISIQSQNAEITGQILQNISILSSDAFKNLQNENIIIVADEHNREIGKIIKENAFFMLENARDKENVQTKSKPEKSGVVKQEVEVKEEVQEYSSSQPVDFDAIEKNLQAICYESDSNNSKDSFRKTSDKPMEAESSFSLEEWENASDSVKDNSNQDFDSDEPLSSRIGMKRKRKSKTISPDKVVAESPSKTTGVQMDKSVRDVINDLEMEDSEEYEEPLTKQALVTKSNQSSGASKIIIKNNVDLSKNNLMLLPVNNKKNSVGNVKNVNSVNKFSEQQLVSKLEVQAEVIQTLTSQLIMYKDMESNVKTLTHELKLKDKEIKALQDKVASEKLSEHTRFDSYVEEAKSDLHVRLMDLERDVKSLTKSNNEEIKNRRLLESKVRRKENTIKELNWKLEKASKFLERSEKNTNNYKKRMYEMRMILKKQKLLNEKNAVFDKLLTCHAVNEFTDEVLEAALDIKRLCSLKGYEKLLEYRFPLPALEILDKKLSKDNENRAIVTHNTHVKSESESVEKFVEDNCESVEDVSKTVLEDDDANVEPLNISSETNTSLKSDLSENKPAEVITDEEDEDMKMEEEVEYLEPEFLKKPTDTVVQTVQDIFDDCSDGEDLIELKKHIMKEVYTDDYR